MDDFSLPVAGRPIKGVSLFNDLVEGPADLLQRSAVVMQMRVKHVHVVQLKSGEGLFDALFDVFFICAAACVNFWVLGCVDLGGDDDFFSGDFEVFEDVAELYFCVTGCV